MVVTVQYLSKQCFFHLSKKSKIKGPAKLPIYWKTLRVEKIANEICRFSLGIKLLWPPKHFSLNLHFFPEYQHFFSQISFFSGMSTFFPEYRFSGFFRNIDVFYNAFFLTKIQSIYKLYSHHFLRKIDNYTKFVSKETSKTFNSLNHFGTLSVKHLPYSK